MPSFKYIARDGEGKLVQGVIEASGQYEVIGKLQEKGLIVTSVAEGSAQQTSITEKAKKRHKKIKLDDLILMARQLTTLLGAGLTLLRSLDLIANQVESDLLHSTVNEVKKDVRGGLSFRDALAKHPKIFSDYWLNLVETGESSGKLPSTLAQLADFLELQAMFQRKIVSALIYPALLMLVAIGAIAVFLLRVIPTFETIFGDFGMQLPALTAIVIKISGFIRHRFLFIGAVLLIGGYLLYRYIQTDLGRWRYDRLKLHFPLIGSLNHMRLTARFARGLSTLVVSGVPLLYGIEIMGRTAGNVVMKEALEKVKVGVRDGKTLAGPLGQSEMFSSMVVQMVHVGEETGELSNMLDKVATYYEQQVDVLVTRMVSLFEPLMIVFMGGVIGVLVLAMFLPIFNLASVGGM